MKMLINGQKKDASNNIVIETLNMATMEVIDTIPAGTIEDAQEAIEASLEGAKIWSTTPTYKRVDIIKKFVGNLRSNSEELAQLLCVESGKPLAHAQNELATAARIFEGFAEESKRLFGQTIPLDIQPGLESDFLLTKREPLGVIVGILAFNFPAELFAQKVGAALASGNAIIVKPPEDDSLTCIRMAEMLLEAGVPGNVLQVVTGYGEVVGDYLSKSPQVNAISFTGSSRVGEIISRNASKNITRTFLELSGNDAFTVFEDADIDLALEHAVMGRLYGNGQVCVSTKRILVEKSRFNEFKEKLIEVVSIKKYGDPLDNNSDIGPVINVKAAEHIESQINNAVSNGAKLLLGGKRKDAFVEPTVLEASKHMDIAKDEEIFGPVFCLIPFEGIDEAIEITNSSSFGLGGAVFTKDIYKAMEAANRIEAGMVSINGGNCYRPDCSAFGGYKKSGIGREGTAYTMEEFTQIKNIVLRGVMSHFS
ncbi:aldehyde dehydrogenase family protein [Peribacillus sp. FSL E2-0159]|uniref:aldehyde dehydrogenase family protein n=1 Tax=Peribacillus sp. FSL E2-0159 TaxID=2975289 RepID=UPI003159FAFA